MSKKPGDYLRLGQWAFNLLVDERPDLSEQVRATPLDPFFVDTLSDTRMQLFLKFVGENWNTNKK
jgi:hypothetical protein